VLDGMISSTFGLTGLAASSSDDLIYVDQAVDKQVDTTELSRIAVWV
jgi:hypothetical protein